MSSESSKSFDVKNYIENNARAKRVLEKWGEAAFGGFQQIPDLLLRNQRRLQLTATELTVLLNITMHWWNPADRPFPHIHNIARRMGISPRTVQRAIAKMETLGLLQRVQSENPEAFAKSFDLSGLTERLQSIALNDQHTQARKKRALHDYAA
tara:strand:+ start:6462 stop:6920 length:459 start_codon:yes stop_codon:yes gene_type:complete